MILLNNFVGKRGCPFMEVGDRTQAHDEGIKKSNKNNSHFSPDSVKAPNISCKPKGL